MKLEIELVPRTCWFSNVRSCVSKKDWDMLRKKAYVAAGHKCEICGGKGKHWPVECHEVWEYDDTKKTQTLLRMCALCPGCHEVKHMGLAGIKGRTKQALKHLAKVNSWKLSQAEDHATKAFATWRNRSTYYWLLDLAYLDGENVKVLDDGRR